MSASSWAQLAVLLVALAATVPLLARYLASVYAAPEEGTASATIGDRLFAPIERVVFRVLGVDPRREQRWNVYAISLLAFSCVSLLAVYALERLQGSLPFNPTGVGGVHPYGAWNAAVSFMTNTNWQWYSGESVMSHLTQMLGLTVQNFVSAAAGMSVAVAIVRGLIRRRARTIGNFWVDLIRTVVRVLLPVAFVAAVLLVACGVIQNFSGYTTAHTVEQPAQVATAATDAPSAPQATQLIPGGPVASQEAIKQLGSNGGGFFNVNSAHPFENPDGWSNLIGTYLILLVPLAFPLMFGRMVGQHRQGYVILGVMLCIWFAMTMFTSFIETNGNPAVAALGVSQTSSSGISAGNLEGKDVRFGPSTCALWASSTTGTSNGSTNCSIDSMTPAGGGLPMLQIMLGEVSPGGVGVGLMTALIYAMLAVFLAGLMVGRTPEYLGKKIQATEMKLAVLFIIAMPMAVLSFAAISVVLPAALSSLINPGAHGLSTILYDYASAANNNGSAFAGLSAGTSWFTITQGVSILIGRFFLIIPALAISGSLVRKNRVPGTSGTFPTDTVLFGALLIGVIVIVAGLTFFPALALGPIVEQLGLK